MSHSTPRGQWPNGAKAAVALSYDDAMCCHHNLVAPALEAHGLRGTFYTPIRECLIDHAERWRAMAAAGHELGNHTIFHPCWREIPEGESPETHWNNLQHFTADRLRNELRVSNLVLKLVDGQTERTYGNTCHSVVIGPPDHTQPIEPILSEMFLAGRGGKTDLPADPRTVDLMKIGTIRGDDAGFAHWRTFVDQAVATSGFALFTFHGVGEVMQRLQVQTSEHEQFLAYLQERREEIWTAPVIEIVRWIRQHFSSPLAD